MIVSFSFLCLISFLYGTSGALADTITARAFLGCAQVLSSRIHCYGGKVGGYTASGSFVNPTGDHFYLDLADFDYSKVSTASNNWTTITGSNGGQYLTANSYQLATSILNKSKFLIYGGYGPSQDGTNTLVQNPLLMYDPPSNTWSSLPLYGHYTTIGAIADISSQQTLWTYGGRVDNTNTYSPNYLFLYQYGKNQWNAQLGDPTNQNVRVSYTATLGSTNRIYMLGGFEAPGNTTGAAYAVDMLKVRWYDTTSNTWGSDTATVSNNQSIPFRAYHTATQIPGTNSLLVYGGSAFINGQNSVHADYAYLYDYTKAVYTPLSLNGTGAGRRSGHAAILYNTDIFFMFGFNENFVLQNDIHVLDVSDPTHLVWRVDASPSSSSSAPASTGTGTTNNNSDPPSSTALSSGAIAGIAVGAAVVLVAIGVAAFLVIRKRSKRHQFQVDDPRYQYPPSGQDDFLPTHFASESTYTPQHDLSSVSKLKPGGGVSEVMEPSKPYSDD